MSWDKESTQANDLKSICKMLDKIGCKTVVVSYDGSGDDGSIDMPQFEKENGHGFTGEILNFSSVRETISDACYNILAELDFDWVNNEGGYGTIEINTATNVATIDHSQRITDTSDSTHEVDL